MNIQSISPYTRPSKGTATGRVWELADEITGHQGFKAKRKQVIDAFVAEGGNPNTASTQFHYWSQKHDEAEQDGSEVKTADNSGGAKATFTLRLDSAGRLLIPVEIRDAMGVDRSGRLTARLIDGELRLISPMAALRRAQKIAEEFKRPGTSLVDEFLSERKLMWGEE
jgi:bifunctional DNA-binding transcriptional regulator/antitoxin component of YhaV-PrlF toxin-antitoxin module